MDDLISRQTAIKAICEDGTWLESQGCTDISMAERKQRDADILSDLPSAQPEHRFDEWCTDCKEYDHERYCCPRFNHVIRTAIDDIVAYRKKEEWIPCSERLPEKGNEVLVCYDYKGHRSVFTGTLYDDGKFYGYYDEYLTPEGRKYRKAVAWMPLPKPYEERKEE